MRDGPSYPYPAGTWGSHLLDSWDTLSSTNPPHPTFTRALRSQLLRENETYHLAYGIAALTNAWNDREYELCGVGASIELVSLPDSTDRALVLKDECGHVTRLASVVVESFVQGDGAEGHTAQFALARGIAVAVDMAKGSQGTYVLVVAGTRMARVVALDAEMVVVELAPEHEEVFKGPWKRDESEPPYFRPTVAPPPSPAPDLFLLDLESLVSTENLYERFPHDLIEGIPPLSLSGCDDEEWSVSVRDLAAGAEPVYPSIQRYYDVLASSMLAVGEVSKTDCVEKVPALTGKVAEEVRSAAGGRVGRSVSLARFIGWHGGRGEGGCREREGRSFCRFSMEVERSASVKTGDGSRPGSRMGSRPGSWVGSRPQSRAESRPTSMVGSRPGSRSECRSGSTTAAPSRSASAKGSRTRNRTSELLTMLVSGQAELEAEAEDEKPAPVPPSPEALEVVRALHGVAVVGVHPAFMDLLVRDAWKL